MSVEVQGSHITSKPCSNHVMFASQFVFPWRKKSIHRFWRDNLARYAHSLHKPRLEFREASVHASMCIYPGCTYLEDESTVRNSQASHCFVCTAAPCELWHTQQSPVGMDGWHTLQICKQNIIHTERQLGQTRRHELKLDGWRDEERGTGSSILPACLSATGCGNCTMAQWRNTCSGRSRLTL